jgi:large subunit ribosomal protein L31
MLINFASPNQREFIRIFKDIKYREMKNGIHPSNYRFVVFQDMSNGTSFLSKSTAPSRENIKWEDGNEYPLIKLEISNTSHPFYTGKMKLVDTAGRVDKYMNRYKDHIGKRK